MGTRIRGKNPPPVYGENSKYFTIAWHYGGRFYLKPNNLAYEHGVVGYIDFVDPDEVLKLTVRMLDGFLKRFGYKLPMEFFYRRYKMSLLVGLVRMKSLDDLKGMVSAIGASKVVEVYMVTPTITFCLPWDSPNVKWRSNVIITEILETDMNRESISEIVIEPESQSLRGDEPQVEIPTQDDGCYVPDKGSHQWDNVEWGDILDGVGVDVSEDWESDFIESFVQRSGSEELRQQGEGEFEGDRQTDVGEDGRRDENDILVESDYEMDEPQVEPTNVYNVNIDIGFGEFVEGSGRSESDYGDSDELESLDSEGELPKRRRTRDEFNPRVDMVNPQFKTGLVFETKQTLIEAVNQYSVITNRELKWKKNDKKRFRAICKKADCPFLLYAAAMSDKTSFQVKTFNEEHNCSLGFNNKRVSAKYMAKKYASSFRSDPCLPLRAFRDVVKQDCNIDISKWTFYRTRTRCMAQIRGSIQDQYKLLHDYCEQLKVSNVGSTVILQSNGTEFRRLYVCLAACRDGFLAGCRKFIGLDGCFLKTEYGGQLLAAVGVDGNNAMFPVAYAVVDTENGENWSWFVSLLGYDLQINNSAGWTFISDKQKGLMQAISTLYEYSEHRTCVRHLYNNFKMTHKGIVLKHALWNAAQATTVAIWQKEMDALKEMDKEAYDWLDAKPTGQWSRSHFRDSSKCDMLLNNLCEAFNSSILNAREQPLLTMLEHIRFNLMKRMVSKKEEVEKWSKEVGPRIFKIIEKNRKALRYLHATYSGDKRFEVRHIHSGHINAVDLVARTCSCRSWQLSGLPCGHVLSSLDSRGMSTDLMLYVSDCYKKEALLRTYSPVIYPMTGPELWPNPGQHPLTPPPIKKMPGRPKKARKREADEHQTSSSKSGRTGMIMKCRRCGKEGHNKRTCKELQTGQS